MNKLILAAGAAVVAAGSATFATATGIGTGIGTGPGISNADPGYNTLNVVGEPYARAVAILRAQGVRTSFGGAIGSDVPQSQCIVSSQKVVGNGKMQLMLDCTEAAQPDVPTSTSVANSPTSGQTSATQPPDAGGVPTPGAPGVVTVVPTRVG